MKFKKILAIILSVILICGVLPFGTFTASAATSGTTGDCTWTLDGTVLTISGNGKMGDYYYIRYAPLVVSLPWGTSIKSVVIEQGVTSIGDYAFFYCDSLTSITIPDSVISIGDRAFYFCDSLTSIKIPDSVTSIGDEAFYYCQSLTSITLPDSVTSIGASAFICTAFYFNSRNWKNNELYINNHLIEVKDYISGSYVIKSETKSICDDAFSGCTRLTSISVNNNNINYSSLDGILFNKNKTELMCYPAGKTNTSYSIPDSVTSIGDYAFYDCTSLTSITIPDSVTSIGNCAFEYCESLTSITIPDSVTSIGDEAFYYCQSLTSITIPDSVTSIGRHTFCRCTSLTSITIPDSVTSIGALAFMYCESLTSITIPDSVTIIGEYLLYYCTSLTSITIPNSVRSIIDYAFYNCTSLTSIKIPDSVTSIGDWAFFGCDSLKNIEILNPNCYIYGNSDTISNTATIYGYKNSTAEEYAKKNNRKFVAFEPKIDGVSISAGADITVNYYSDYGLDSDMRFTMNGKETVVKGVYDSDVGKYVYKFTGVTPERIADEIKAELITDGEVVAVKEGFSVKNYLDTVLSKTNTDFGMSEEKFLKLKTLACDLLNYSAAAQKYFGYKTDSLVNNGVTGGTVFTAPTKTDKDITNASKNGVSFTGQNLYFDSTNKLMFRFKVDTSVITDITKLEIKISNGDEIKTVGYKDFEALGNNTYIVYTDDIYATEFDSVFTATACYNGVDGANVKYSVNSYIYAMCNKTNIREYMLELAKATYNYGLSAKEYAKAK